MKNPILVPELRELLAAGREQEILDFATAVHPATVADLVAPLRPAEAWRVLQLVAAPLRASIFGYFELDVQVEVAALLTRRELAELVSQMSADDRVDLFHRLPESARTQLLPALAHAEREDIRRLAAYAPGTAGAVMTSDYATLSPEMTAGSAIEHLRRIAPDTETIYVAYIVDAERRLVGHVSLRSLILAPPERIVADLMTEETIFVRVDEDQEEVARRISSYDLLAIPVVDGEMRLVGIVTYDDALDILRQEQQEDVEKFAAITGTHAVGTYLRTPATTHFRNRVLWVVGLAAAGLLSGMVIHSYEGVLEKLLLLALYMPMVADTGGNTGSQSATIIVRALALGEVRPRDALRVLYKELQISLLLAALLGLLAYGKVLLLSAGAEIPVGLSLPKIGVAIALALAAQVVTATLVGAVLPLAAATFKHDPAVVSAPALTTVVDITGLLIYFSVARLILGV
jgi:magnesium transporter